MAIFGWDASDYDHARGPMDMVAARRDGIDFYIHKATEGIGIRHRPGASLAAARDAGIPFLGCYMVPRTALSVSAQVDYFLSWVDQQVPWWRGFPGWFWQVDTEHWGYDNVSAQRGHDVAVMLARRTGKRVLHYAPKWAYGNTIPGDEPLWASSYVGGAGPYRSLYPGDSSSRWSAYSGRTPAVLQYTSSATIGRQGKCDANAFRGTVADFAALIGAGPAGGGAAVPSTGNGEDMSIFLRVEDGGDLTGAPHDAGAVYLPTVAGPKHITGRELASTRAVIMYVESWRRLLELAPSAGAPTEEQVHTIAATVVAELIAAPDVPLGEADQPTIVEAVKRAVRELFGLASAG